MCVYTGTQGDICIRQPANGTTRVRHVPGPSERTLQGSSSRVPCAVCRRESPLQSLRVAVVCTVPCTTTRVIAIASPHLQARQRALGYEMYRYAKHGTASVSPAPRILVPHCPHSAYTACATDDTTHTTAAGFLVVTDRLLSVCACVLGCLAVGCLGSSAKTNSSS